ncbi:hypothetical protein BGZ63DRAFT_492537 [Mariannaea sp. PMI_226]|nr:hypothetical protein BGZ63DRAFT_492537 [Mariannaea sp. PMI_226]
MTATKVANSRIGGGIKVADGQLLPHQIGFLRQSDPSLPIETLRERYKEDNYLYLKGLLPREHALKARDAYFRFLSPSDALKPETSPVDGIFNPDNQLSDFGGLSSRQADLHKPKSERAAVFADLTAKAHTEKFYTEDFCQHPNLEEFVAKLTEWKDVQQFKRSLLRCNIPGTNPVGVHYDQIFLRQGEASNITAWCVMGDIKIQGGGLMYLEKSECPADASSGLGEEIEADFTKRAIETGLSEEEAKFAYNRNMIAAGGLSSKPLEFAAEHNRRWLVSDFEAGDVVLHNPFTIHASTVNADPDSVIRLSTDLRFYDASRPYDKRWLHYFYPGDEV